MEVNTQDFEYSYSLQVPLEEDIIWRKDVFPHLNGIARSVVQICQYGFTEMANNALEHSGAQTLKVKVSRGEKNIRFTIIDDGIGIFKKIKNDLGLAEPGHAILELIKGKFTSDPQRHSGEGIFFTSRLFDTFTVASDDLSFTWFKNGKQFELLNNTGSKVQQ